MRRVLVSGELAWSDTEAIRLALAPYWAPDHVLMVGDGEQGAEALCVQCWQHWGGRVERFPHTVDRYGHGDGAEALRIAAMLARRADVALVFQSGSDVPLVATLADLAGVPVRILHRG